MRVDDADFIALDIENGCRPRKSFRPPSTAASRSRSRPRRSATRAASTTDPSPCHGRRARRAASRTTMNDHHMSVEFIAVAAGARSVSLRSSAARAGTDQRHAIARRARATLRAAPRSMLSRRDLNERTRRERMGTRPPTVGDVPGSVSATAVRKLAVGPSRRFDAQSCAAARRTSCDPDAAGAYRRASSRWCCRV